jgi:hypothetical protein
MSIRSEEKKKILEEIKSKRIDDGEIRNAIGLKILKLNI